MKQIQDPGKLAECLRRYRIEELFETKQLPFLLRQYERGEILRSPWESANSLQFVVAGAVQIYGVRRDGSYTPLTYTDDFTLLGDMEFCGEFPGPHVVEAVQTVLCVELPLSLCREQLLEDNTFLRFLLRSVVRKTGAITQLEVDFDTVEQKLLYYMRHSCPGGELRGVEAAAIRLRCSRRQLQRALQSLCGKGRIEKVAKGVYRVKISSRSGAADGL